MWQKIHHIMLSDLKNKGKPGEFKNSFKNF